MTTETATECSEAVFLEWCKARGYQCQIRQCGPHDKFVEDRFVVYVYSYDDIGIERDGATPGEARARVMADAPVKE